MPMPVLAGYGQIADVHFFNLSDGLGRFDNRLSGHGGRNMMDGDGGDDDSDLDELEDVHLY
ncbi:hypothetical protein AWENTII_002003 [Aspergillus wentii]